MGGNKAFLACALIMMLLPTSLTSVSASLAPQVGPSRPQRVAPVVTSASGAFAFVSNFEDMTLDGWKNVQGAAPQVVSPPNYSGEPVLKSAASSGPQIDFANQGFVTGASYVSFQVAVRTESNSRGYFGLGSQNSGFTAVVGVSGKNVVAGRDLGSLGVVEAIPTGTAYPDGWVYITANVFQSSGTWVMQVFVDRTDVLAAQVSVPSAGSYRGALIETTKGTVYYTDIVVSTYQIGTLIPGYNNMEGYGQGSGTLVKLLPAYYNLTARMTLDSWSIPQKNILSFQINAMNMTGTKESTCAGFFQLGVDLNPNGYLAPWYVPGVNCVPSYFLGKLGVGSPAHSQLVLSIVLKPAARELFFKIVDLTTSQTFSASIPYSGGAFYGTYTQMEFQPCCNKSPIADYTLKGQLYDLVIVTGKGQTQSLPASYMLPYSLDAPPTWDFTYYQNGIAGYSQTST